MAAFTANTLSLFLIFGTFFLVAQYLQLVLGLSPLRAGLWSVPSSLGFTTGSLVAPALMRRLGPRITMTYGLAVAAIGLLLLTQLPARGGHGLALTLAGSTLLALGLSPVVTLATDLIVGAVPPEQAGQASGLSETGTELGGALGIALLGSITTAVYRSQLPDALPAGLRPQTLGDAAQSAAALPHRVGAPLLDSRDAFTQGLHLAAIISAVLAVLLAVLAATVLRRGAAAEENETRPVDSARRHAQLVPLAEPCGDS